MQTQPQLTAHSAGLRLAADAPRLTAINPVHLPELWPEIADLVAGVVERSRGRYSNRGVAQHLMSGDWHLWVVGVDGEIRAIVATELYRDVSGIKCCTIRFCTGRGSETWTHLLEQIEAWARADGCVRMDMIARKGWAKRLPDYRLSHVYLEKKL